MMTEVSAMDRQSFRSVTSAFLGTETTVTFLKHVGIEHWDRDWLNMSVNTISQLVSACTEDAARDAVWAGSLARLNMFKCFTHFGGEGETAGFGIGPC